MSDTGDLHHAANIFVQDAYPDLWRSVARVSFPNFYYAFDLGKKKQRSPYFQMTASLPFLEELTIRFVTSSVTASRWSERQQNEYEHTDLRRSLEKKVLDFPTIVSSYELNGLFACRCLRHLRIEYIDCEWTAYHCTVGNPVQTLRDLQTHLIHGFASHNMTVHVALIKVPGQ
jgi:hypothetical protein